MGTRRRFLDEFILYSQPLGFLILVIIATALALKFLPEPFATALREYFSPLWRVGR